MKTLTKLSLFLATIMFALGTFNVAYAQTPIALSGTSYSQNFNGLATSAGVLPIGWSATETATATTLGTPIALLGAPLSGSAGDHVEWNNTGTGFRNRPSSTGQNTADEPNRALSVRQAAANDALTALPAFILTLENTVGFENFTAAFDLQSVASNLDATNPRVTTWQVQFSVNGGTVWTNATTGASIMTTGGGNTITNNRVTATFPEAINNIGSTVHIRIIPTGVTTSGGSGNPTGSRPATSIDNFLLTFSVYVPSATATPVFSLSGGNFVGTQNVALTSVTPNAQIRFTTNGDTPTETSTLFENPIAVSQTTRIRAVAFSSDLPPSAVVEETFVIRNQGDIIITQIYGGAASANPTYNRRFVELFNTTNANIDLDGLFILYAANTSLNVGMGGGGNNSQALSGTIPARGFFLLTSDPTSPTGTVAIPTFPTERDLILNASLSGTAGKVAIATVAQQAITANFHDVEGIMDLVAYGAGHTNPAGIDTTGPNLGATWAVKRIFENCEFRWERNRLSGLFARVAPSADPLPRNSQSPRLTPAVVVKHDLATNDLDLGDALANRPAFVSTETFELTLACLGANLTLAMQSGSGSAFSVYPTSIDRAVFGDTVITVTFAPDAITDFNDVLVISGGGLANPIEIALTGTGLSPYVPFLRFASHTDLPFGSVVVGNTNERAGVADLHANNLEYDIVITFASTGEASGTHFTAAPDTDFDVRDGGLVSITFAPTTYGLLHDTLIITSGTETDRLALYGTGVTRIAAPVALPATHIDRFSFTANWETVADVVTFSVRVYEGAEATGEPLLTRTAADSLTSLAINGLAPNTQHTFVVVARAELIGNADTSNVITFTTLPLGENIIFTFADSLATPANQIANLTVSAITGMADPVAEPVINTGAASTVPFSGGYNLALMQRTTQGTYAEFTLTPDNGYIFTLEGVSFAARSAATGPTSWALRSSRDDFYADLATGTIERDLLWVMHYALALEFESSVPVTFRIVAIDGGASATASFHNFRIDDVELGITMRQDPTSICPRDIEETTVALFPNPVVDVLNIAAEQAIATVRIYNLAGQVVVQQHGNRDSVDVSTLPRGTYIVRIVFENGTILTQTIVK